jgi:hypothetical protein
MVNVCRLPGKNFDSRVPLGAKEKNMLWTIFVVLLVLWLLGFTLHIGGGLIHLLIVVAVIVLIFNLITGSRRAW